MRRVQLSVTAFIICAVLAFYFANAMAQNATTRPVVPSADVELIVGWLNGAVVAPATQDRFVDQQTISAAKETLFFTDINSVNLPTSMKNVTYEFIRARMSTLKGGESADPAVIITHATALDPENGLLRTARKPNAGERYYYVEVAMGNLAWRCMKLVVYEFNRQSHIEVLWSKQS